VEIRKGLEVEMSGVKRRKNQFREALDAKREALASAAKQPKQEPEPEWEPEPPELRAEVLADHLVERDADLAKEQERRAAERHSETSSTTRGDRLIELSEESDYERRIRAWTSQGYPRHDAVWRIALQDRMEASG
jgi:hypothetical protein